VYLNSIEMGMVRVWRSSSDKNWWYRKDAKDLTPIQAAGIGYDFTNQKFLQPVRRRISIIGREKIAGDANRWKKSNIKRAKDFVLYFCL
jgi:hypothetical protein